MKRLLVFFACLCVAAAASAAGHPQLIVVISVDQLRWDYLDTFAPWFSTRGFNRFRNEGATFPNTMYLHAVTFTGPGHAAIGTGALPAEHGIVGNTWFERDAAYDPKRWDWYFDDTTPYAPPLGPDSASSPSTPAVSWAQFIGGSPQYCVYDPRVTVSAGKTHGMSPETMSGDSLGDRVKNRYPHARVMGVAIKDRAAILMSGRLADQVYWFDSKLPGFISSSYYRYDPRMFAFNSGVAGYIPGSAEWRPSGFIPDAEVERVTFDPPAAWPLKNNKYKGTFPHPVADVKALTYTPFANDVILDFTLRLIATEKLGETPNTPDLLFVGLSPTDYLGHYYGPDSKEAADNMVRLDRSLERFLDALERRFGKQVVVALTADHGVQANPEIVKLRDPKADAGRVDLRNPRSNAQRIADLPPARIEIERRTAKLLRLPFSESSPLTDTLVAFFEEPALYVNWKHADALKLDHDRVKRALRDAVQTLQSTIGIDHVWTDTELLSPTADPLMRASYRSDRSGDVLMSLRPGWIWTWGSNSTTHGQPVENDRHVPLMLWGSGITPGRYDVSSAPTDLAPTLGALVGVAAGGRASRVLPCVAETR